MPHAKCQIASSDEGTNYCPRCEQEGREQEAVAFPQMVAEIVEIAVEEYRIECYVALIAKLQSMDASTPGLIADAVVQIVSALRAAQDHHPIEP